MAGCRALNCRGRLVLPQTPALGGQHGRTVCDPGPCRRTSYYYKVVTDMSDLCRPEDGAVGGAPFLPNPCPPHPRPPHPRPCRPCGPFPPCPPDADCPEPNPPCGPFPPCPPDANCPEPNPPCRPFPPCAEGSDCLEPICRHRKKHHREHCCDDFPGRILGKRR